MRYIVYIKADSRLKEKVRKYRKEKERYIEKLPSFAPHCSIFVSDLDESKEGKIISSLERIAGKQKPFIIRFTQTNMFDNNALVAEIDKNNGVDSFHRKTIDALFPYIKKDETRELPKEYAEDPERKEAHSRYGSPYVGKFFRPHMTLWHMDPKRYDGYVHKLPHSLLNTLFIASAMILAVKENKEADWKTINQLKFND